MKTPPEASWSPQIGEQVVIVTDAFGTYGTTRTVLVAMGGNLFSLGDRNYYLSEIMPVKIWNSPVYQALEDL